MKHLFLLFTLSLLLTIAKPQYVTIAGNETITGNKNFSGSFYGFNGFTDFGLGEGVHTGWQITHGRIDIVSPNDRPLLYLSKPSSNTTIDATGGAVFLSVATTTGDWGVSPAVGDAILRAEGPSALNISAESGNISFYNLPTYNGSSISTQAWVNSQNFLKPDSYGNVGIGTSNTGPYKLAVEGSIGAREIKVTLANPWADYVFNKNYQLRSLYSLGKFIQANKHLPGIPSAAEVEKAGGVELGKMNSKLLEKVEELTLYVIHMQKENDEIKKQIKRLQRKVK